MQTSPGVSAMLAKMDQALVDQQAITTKQFEIMPQMAASQAAGESAKRVQG